MCSYFMSLLSNNLLTETLCISIITSCSQREILMSTAFSKISIFILFIYLFTLFNTAFLNPMRMHNGLVMLNLPYPVVLTI